MAENSMREQILVAQKTAMLQLQWVKAVKRGRPDFNQLQSIPNTQFPFISVTGSLPIPQPKRNEQQPYASYTKFISTLRTDIVVYDVMADSDRYDELVSKRADDVWAKVYEDPSFGSLCLSCVAEPEPVIGVWIPYVAFKIILVTTYHHGTGGI